MPTVDESQLAPLPLPGSMKGLRPSCRWPGCKTTGPGRPLCAATHRNRLLSMSKDGDVPPGFDPETCDPAEFTRAWSNRQTRIDGERKAKRGPAPAPEAFDVLSSPIKTYPLGPFLADTGFSEGADVTIPGESATPAGWEPVGPDESPPPMSEIDAVRAWAERAEVAIGKLEIERDAAMDANAREVDNRGREVGMLRDEIANRDAQIGRLKDADADANVVLDSAGVPSGLPLGERVRRLADKAWAARTENDALAEVLRATGKERDEAVAAISSARADSAELAALREYLTTGGGTAGLAVPTYAAHNAYDDRREGNDSRRDRRPVYDVPRMLNVAEYAVGQLLDLIADEAGRDCAPSPEVLRALRALTLGRVPDPSTESPVRTDKAER